MWCSYRYYREFSCRKKILNAAFVNCLWRLVHSNVNSHEIRPEVNYAFDLSRSRLDASPSCNRFPKFSIMLFGRKEIGFLSNINDFYLSRRV